MRIFFSVFPVGIKALFCPLSVVIGFLHSLVAKLTRCTIWLGLLLGVGSMPSRHMKLFRNKEICISIMQIGCKNDMVTIYDRHLSINLQVPSVILQTFVSVGLRFRTICVPSCLLGVIFSLSFFVGWKAYQSWLFIFYFSRYWYQPNARLVSLWRFSGWRIQPLPWGNIPATFIASALEDGGKISESMWIRVQLLISQSTSQP